jgi:ribosomal protein S6
MSIEFTQKEIKELKRILNKEYLYLRSMIMVHSPKDKTDYSSQLAIVKNLENKVFGKIREQSE